MSTTVQLVCAAESKELQSLKKWQVNECKQSDRLIRLAYSVLNCSARPLGCIIPIACNTSCNKKGDDSTKGKPLRVFEILTKNASIDAFVIDLLARDYSNLPAPCQYQSWPISQSKIGANLRLRRFTSIHMLVCLCLHSLSCLCTDSSLSARVPICICTRTKFKISKWKF